MNLYLPSTLLSTKNSNSYFELLKSRDRLYKSNRDIDARIQSKITWVQNKQEADVYILPHDWQFYYSQKRENEAIAFCKAAEQEGKLVLSHAGGDQGITVPVPENTIVYRQAGYKSKLKANERIAPFFLSDPITNVVKKNSEAIVTAPNKQKPVVGFCGMAPHGMYTGLKESIQVFYRNIRSSYHDRQEIMSSSNLRYKALMQFERQSSFETNFIIRSAYRGGKQTAENRKKTTMEYYQNQIDSDLIVCARGVGNFSVRFYETLAMGRIPIFIDTDSPLPNIAPLRWDDYIIHIDRKDIQRIVELSENWLRNKDLTRLKTQSRALWLSHFRLDSFWLNQLQEIEKILQSSGSTVINR